MSKLPVTIPAQDLDDQLPPSAVDARGRLLPLSPEERARYQAEVRAALDEIGTIGTPEEQRASLDALMRAIDEDRALRGAPKAFEGLYEPRADAP